MGSHYIGAGFLLNAEKESQRLMILPQYEFGDLGSLMDRDKGQRLANENVAVWIASKLYAAVKFIQTERVLHLDITQTNVLINNKGYPILADFRRTKLYEDVTVKRCPPALCYASPDILEKKQVDGMADLWSVACCLYQILLRCVPYPGRTADECLANISLGLPRNLLDLPLKAMDFLAFELHPSRQQRLGYECGVTSVMRHILFNDVDWDLACMGAQTEESPLLEIIDIVDDQLDDGIDENQVQKERNGRGSETHSFTEHTGLSPVIDP